MTLLLPHGYEARSEHSSARLERFLQLSAEMNNQVCVPSTPRRCSHAAPADAARPAQAVIA